MSDRILAIDFGTSNSAAAVLMEGALRRLPIEVGSETLPTAVFFDADTGAMRIGEAAAAALIEGEDGRYMRALKSVLGTALFHEKRLIGGKRRTLAEIVTAFIVAVKQRAEAQLGGEVCRVLSGRPVHFHSSDPERDAQAEADLRGCYEAAGFTEVGFMFEPEAAARASLGRERRGELGLIVDIGGGTSDFTVFRAEADRLEVLASHGIRLGGTDFDREVSLLHAMPLLGHGGQLKREMGAGVLPMPVSIFVDLATWAKIPFLYAPDVRRSVAQMQRSAVEPRPLARLASVLEDELGHELAFAVERGKIAANGRGAGIAAINMTMIERALSAEISPASLALALSKPREMLAQAARETLDMAGVQAEQITAVILVGGSSLMTMVGEVARDLCPDARIEMSDAFTAVVDGLALATGDAARR
ncbi:Hsp70 family protein [Pseudooceanicola sediminis]|uniref:Hsp70 family protein n=1 Tax=Pseudooceanicola sediminis TaxID=2211117 RepID=A0A399J1H2_9RHOB|nr:Hsp70 family protein [Pseudooceanicola sediminis]KAA2313114.1 Hsp70 family protein [Puniceibacterium sp. HSS470]RII37762.1 Hsp70 family protein [Pseudooceanicola sediminis]|tara:strand:- start:55768 stop:57024 length:1257 start_codon:yes stop_codon:yes gene_type:complete